jgi:glycosyltransferase involved in cell wall biosynthesis
MNDLPLVSVICTAYNHEAYIKDALDGFIIQKTNFPIEIIVHDDASTDQTAEIIKGYEKRYPDLFANIYQSSNQFSKGKGDIGRIVFGAARGKYIALCEGDDYWVDPHMLQRHVDFLELNDGCGLSFGDFIMVDIQGHQIEKSDYIKKMSSDDYINGNNFVRYIENKFLIHPVSAVFRKKALDLFPLNFEYLYDVWLFERILFYFKINKFSEVVAAYRNTEGSITKSDNFIKKVQLAAYDNFKYFSNIKVEPEMSKTLKILLFKRSLHLMGSPFLSKKEKLGLIKYVIKYLPNVMMLIKIMLASKKLKNFLTNLI